MWAASAGVRASAIACSKATRASSARPSCMSSAPLHAEEMEVAASRGASGSIIASAASGPSHLGHRDGAVERDDRRGLQPLERGVEQLDLRPVGVLGARGARVQRRDRRLDLIGPGRAVAHRLVEQRQPLVDQRRGSSSVRS